MDPIFAVMVEGKQTPSKVHRSFDEAETEAIRLAKIERQPVYILKAVAKVEMTDVKITHLG
jgi:hypothetical protein